MYTHIAAAIFIICKPAKSPPRGMGKQKQSILMRVACRKVKWRLSAKWGRSHNYTPYSSPCVRFLWAGEMAQTGKSLPCLSSDSRTHLDSRIHQNQIQIHMHIIIHAKLPSKLCQSGQWRQDSQQLTGQRAHSHTQTSHTRTTLKDTYSHTQTSHTHTTHKDKELNIIKFPQQPSTEAK